jgi:hypothetical protein
MVQLSLPSRIGIPDVALKLNSIERGGPEKIIVIAETLSHLAAVVGCEHFR